MNRTSPYLAISLLLSGSVTTLVVQADTFRCGSQLVSTGDRAFEVEQKCGPPAHRELVGYTLGRYERYETVVEEWVYGPANGMLGILRFEGNRLVNIETRRGR
ncbi:DUF2845 domain-containing protein [Azomonas macrocytogenes]|uniref:DUF2845 domain-containing protein n=1 Tax=Azomonas macrocytogenes TaxID=69962 RepID=A0A839T499_AZOMA|nr:DUF2845 domain-containing protein [Azomonas macrocytogenes]MBB3104252.1 hypothetical protein [Azomonas macrocytogenes]